MYKDLYTKKIVSRHEIRGLQLSKFTEEQSVGLVREVKEQKVQEAIDGLAQEIGPDGFLIVVYQKSWHFIKNDLLRE